MASAFVALGLVALAVGGVALVRGNLHVLRIATRAQASLVAGVGFALLVVAGALAPQTSEPVQDVAEPASEPTTEDDDTGLDRLVGAPNGQMPQATTGRVEPTPEQIAADQTVLGANKEAFVALLGTPNGNSVYGSLHFQACADGHPDQYIVGHDSTEHVTDVLRQFCYSRPTREQMQLEARKFFPPDTVDDGSGSTLEGESVPRFQSASFGQSISTDYFVDCTGDPVPAGTFVLSVSEDAWELLPGSCA